MTRLFRQPPFAIPLILAVLMRSVAWSAAAIASEPAIHSVAVTPQNQILRLTVPASDGLSTTLAFPKPAFSSDIANQLSFRLVKQPDAAGSVVPLSPPQQVVTTTVGESATVISVGVSAAPVGQAVETLLEVTIPGPGVEMQNTFLAISAAGRNPQTILGELEAEVWAAVRILNRTGVDWPEAASLEIRLDGESKIDAKAPAGGLKSSGRHSMTGITKQRLTLTFGVGFTDLVVPPSADRAGDVTQAKLSRTVCVTNAASAKKVLAFLQSKRPSAIHSVAGSDWSELMKLSATQSAQLFAGSTIVDGPLGGESRLNSAEMAAEYDLAGISAGYLFYRPSWKFSVQVSSQASIEADSLKKALESMTPAGWEILDSAIKPLPIAAGADLKTAFQVSATFQCKELVSRSLLLTDVDGLSQLGSRGDLLALTEKSIKKSLDSFASLEMFLKAATEGQESSKVLDELQKIATDLGCWQTKLRCLLSFIETHPTAVQEIQARAQEVADGFNDLNNDVLKRNSLPALLLQDQPPSRANGQPCPTPDRP